MHIFSLFCPLKCSLAPFLLPPQFWCWCRTDFIHFTIVCLFTMFMVLAPTVLVQSVPSIWTELLFNTHQQAIQYNYRLNTYPFRAAPYKLSYDNWPASAAVLVHCVVPWTCCCCLLYWLRFLTPPSANLHSKGSSCPTQNEKELYNHTG